MICLRLNRSLTVDRVVSVTMWSVILLSILASAQGQTQTEGDPPSVTIAQGSVVGTAVTSSGFTHYEFHGIPYADSTSGSHRFKAPRPAPTFTQTFVADRKGIKCVKAIKGGYEGTEDCLVANVYTPAIDPEKKYPVMVWIKGSEFEKTKGPELSFRNLMEKEVIVVSLNFRESILGYLCLGTETAPGNAGLKDIIAGLQWVKDNIEQFGGDPESITLFGHGSGAAAVDLVTLSPMSKGLVHRAIAQSGSSISPWSVTRDPTQYAILVAEQLGHEITEELDIEKLSEVFTRTSVAALMAVIDELDLTDNSLAFAPCIENEHLDDEKFLEKSPFSTLTEETYTKIPMIFGFVENEGTIRFDEALEANWLTKMDQSFSDFIQPDLEFETTEEKESIAKEIRSRYFNSNPINMENIESYIDYHGDTMVLISVIREARLRAGSGEPTYLYEFSYQGAVGDAIVGSLPASVVGAAHGQELAYLFDIDTAATVETNAGDEFVQKVLVERWTNFAKTGRPTSESSASFWPVVNSGNTNVLLIRNEPNSINQATDVPITDPHREDVDFWNQIYEKHFLDAEGHWTAEEKEEEEEEEEVDTTEDPLMTTETPETEPDVPDSAPAAVGYTFLILAFFAVVDKFHSAQILA
uniref:Carboxyl/cholinesterase-002b n=1 Tax=Plutella xylostella TaxID=51655 RepID=A0A1L8D6M3_PLUXY